MHTVNIHDRETIKRAYPHERFQHDARVNSEAKTTVHRGVRILSEPDADGAFRLTHAAEHVGENDPEGDSVFLCPYLGEATDVFMEHEADYRAPVEKRDALAIVPDYDGFIERIIDAAGSAHFKDAIGRGEERLRGFHGGD